MAIQLKNLNVVSAMVGTAGHVDHGKTELTKHLTGIDTDRLVEEKQRGLSINLGFAPLTFKDGSTVGIVDVPGHRDFIRNMVAGAASVDVLMLVVAGDDGVMPQTVEHMRILKLLTVPRVMVVVTKIDLIDNELLALVRDDIEDLLTRMDFSRAPICFVSNKTRQGLGEVKRTLEMLVRDAIADTRSASKDNRAFRMNIERGYTVKGFGTVVSGIPVSGTAQHGEEMELIPNGVKTHIRGIQKYRRESDTVNSRQCAAINLRDVSLNVADRGVTIAVPDIYTSTTAFVSTLENANDDIVIKHQSTVRLHSGTSSTNATVTMIGTGKLNPGTEAFAHVKLSGPITLCAGDKFIIRRLSPPSTLGGGVVLACDVTKVKRKSLHLLESLEKAKIAIESGDHLGAALHGSMTAIFSNDELRRLTQHVGETAEQLVSQKVATKALVALGDSWLLMTRLDQVVQSVKKELSKYHRNNKYVWGMNPGQLCKQLGLSVRSFGPLVDLITQADPNIVKKSGCLALDHHRPALSAKQITSKDTIERRLTQLGMSPLSRGDLAAELKISKSDFTLLTRLLHGEGLIKTVGHYLISTDALNEYRNQLFALSGSEGIVELGAFRAATQSNRRLAVAILESFDIEGLTKRTKTGRKLKSSRNNI